MFLHYQNQDIALAKWKRRCERVNFDNLIVKFNDQNLFSQSDYESFNKMQFQNKLFFTTDRKFDEKFAVCFEDKLSIGCVNLDMARDVDKVFKLKKYLNSIKELTIKNSSKN